MTVISSVKVNGAMFTKFWRLKKKTFKANPLFTDMDKIKILDMLWFKKLRHPFTLGTSNS